MATDAEYYSVNIKPGNGVQSVFEISFAGGYISRDHVKAYMRVGGLEQPASLTFLNDFTVQVSPVPPAGSTLVIYRETPKDKPLADFSDGSIVTERNLDVNAKQAVFIAAEAQDLGAEKLNTLELQSIKSAGGGLVGDGFVVVGKDGVASAQDFVTVLKTAIPIADDGAWGSGFLDDGAWG